MKREYHKWFSPALGRDMELLVFGHAGLPALVFPTSCGRFFEFEDRGMVHARARQARTRPPPALLRRLGRHRKLVQPQRPSTLAHRPPPSVRGISDEGGPSLHPSSKINAPGLPAVGCSFGGTTPLNIALRHPDVFHLHALHSAEPSTLQLLGRLLRRRLLLQHPHPLLPNLTDPWYPRSIPPQHLCPRHRRSRTMPTRERTLRPDPSANKNIPCRLDVWGDNTGHDWPWWQSKCWQTYPDIRSRMSESFRKKSSNSRKNYSEKDRRSVRHGKQLSRRARRAHQRPQHRRHPGRVRRRPAPSTSTSRPATRSSSTASPTTSPSTAPFSSTPPSTAPSSSTIPSGGSADDKFFNYTLAAKLGVAVPPTVILPHKQHPRGTTDRSMRNLEFPLDWEAVFAYVGEHGFLKPVDGGGWRDVLPRPQPRRVLRAPTTSRATCA